MKKPKVLFVTTSYPIFEGSLSGIFVKRLADSLSNQAEVKVLCPAGTVASRGDVLTARYAPRQWQVLAHQPGGIPVALKSNKWLICLVPLMLISMFLNTFMASRKCDYILAHWSISGAIAGISSRWFSKPLITVFHGSDANSIHESTINKIFALVALRFSHRVVGVSESICSALRESFPKFAHKIIFVPNGVEESLLDIEKKSALQNKLLVIANLNPKKGVQDLIKAVSLIQNNKPLELTVVGDGPQKLELQGMVKELKIEPLVTFVGAVKPDEVCQYLASADVFILPSYAEGRPSVILEAMATGKAVIATNLPGIMELVQDEETGLIYDVGNVDQLAEKLGSILGDSDKAARLGNQARDSIVQNKLIWPHTANAYLEAFNLIQN